MRKYKSLALWKMYSFLDQLSLRVADSWLETQTDGVIGRRTRRRSTLSYNYYYIIFRRKSNKPFSSFPMRCSPFYKVLSFVGAKIQHPSSTSDSYIYTTLKTKYNIETKQIVFVIDSYIVFHMFNFFIMKKQYGTKNGKA